MTPHVPITDLVNELCKRFYVEPKNVADILIEPHTVTLHVFKLNDEGAKYVADADGVPVRGKHRGEVKEPVGAAMETLVISVKT